MSDRINLQGPPYFDRFDSKSNRTKLLFHADRSLQQAELNELQSIAEFNVAQLGDSVFSEGSMQTGMEFSINPEEKKITIGDGLVYVSGKVRQFKEQSIEFHGEGTEKIGVKVQRRVIDYNMDPSLLDPTQGTPNYLSPGADRLEETVVLTYNDDEAPVIYEFVDGDLFIEPVRPDLSLINDLLATRTYEESGSYRVSGFNMWTEEGRDQEDENKLTLIIDSGIAYVLGYRISKPTASRIPIRKSTDFHEVINETHTYKTSDRNFRVGSYSVKDVTRVMARTESPSTGVQMAKGVTDGRDAIPSQYTSIDRETTRLWTNSPEVVYEYGRDYTIVEENGIQYVNWNTGNLNGRQPSSGTTYYLSFEYIRRMLEGTDYQIKTVPFEGDNPGWETYVDFNGMTGHKPKNDALVSVDYTFYLTRMDLVVLDSKGNFTVIEGQPGRPEDVEAPAQEDPLTLRIGIVTVFPNTYLTSTRLNSITRLRMEDLQKMKERIENIEYNQAILMLEMEATITENPLDLRGVFAEGFINFDRMDKELSNVAFSFDDASITLPTDTHQDGLKQPDMLPNSVAHVWGRLVSAPFKERVEIFQPLASEAWNVNPYLVFNRQGVMTLNPSSDNWIEEEEVTVINEKVKSMQIGRWWSWRDPNKQTTVKRENEAKFGDVVWDDGGNLHSFRGAKGDTRTGVIETSSQTTTEQVVDYIRQREVSFKVKNLAPMADNLTLTFDGITVPVTPTGNTAAGSTSGTVRSNSRGEASGKFKIPKGVRTGTREVVLSNNRNNAFTTYTAHGIRKVTENVVLRTRVTATYYDPLAQSFAFPQERVVSSVGLYFASKSRNNENIIIQIRGMSEGGNPNTTIYSEVTLTPDQIKISDDASVETKVPLDDPLMAKAGEGYCVVIITDSADYTMWAATMGNNQIDRPNEIVNNQPYVNGVLFSSSNARTWTAHQKSDLKFKIYTAEFQETGVIEFGEMKDLDADHIMIMSSYLTPGNTGCHWDVKVIKEEDVGLVGWDDVPWRPLINYAEIETSEIGIVGLAKLRATFKASRYVSPLLALDDILFVNFISATEGDYVSRNINTADAPFNKLIISYDRYTPLGASVTPYYSLDAGQTWREVKATPNVVQRSSEFQRVTFEERVSTNPTNRSVKFKLTLRGENRFVRPRVRQFTALWRDEIDN